MGRSPCCSKEGLNRGAWTAIEDKILTAYIKAHGEGNWRNLPKRAGLKRCGKSCRLRWLNYLRPDIKRGNISRDEEELIIRLHNLLGNRWSLIAGRLPGRTDNEIKNYWNTTLGKKVGGQTSSLGQSLKHKRAEPSGATQTQAIRTKATRCTKVLIPTTPSPNHNYFTNSSAINSSELQGHDHQSSHTTNNSNLECGNEDLHFPHSCNSNFLDMGLDANDDQEGDYNYNNDLAMDCDYSLPFDTPMFKEWVTDDCIDNNVSVDLGFLSSLLDCEEWP